MRFRCILSNFVLQLLILATCLAAVKKVFIYDAAFKFNVDNVSPLSILLNLHFRKVVKRKKAVYNYFFTYHNATVRNEVPYKMRVLLPFPVERSSEINFGWGINNEEQEDCNLTINRVKFYSNHTWPVDYCPLQPNTTIEPFNSVRIVRCPNFEI